MPDYEKIEQWARILKVAEILLANEEFVEVRVGSKELGGANLRLKGKTVHCNISGVPSFQFNLPQDFIDKVLQAIPLLKAALEAEVTS